MKFYLTVIGAFLTFNSFAQSIYTYDGKFSSETKLNYFYMTDFYNQYSYCYTGDAKDACDLVKNGAEISYKNYQVGANDYFEVVSCDAVQDQINVSANLYNGYHEVFKLRNVSFGKCE